MKSVKDATLSGAKWGFIEQISILGTRFILSIIMARLLSPENYGAVSMIMIFITISEVFVDSGFNNALLRKKDHTNEDYSTAFVSNFAISIVCYVVLYISSPAISSFYNMPILKDILRIQSISLILNAFSAIQITKFSIDLNFKAIAKCNLITSLLSGIFGVILAYCGFGVWALVWQTIFSCCAKITCVLFESRWFPFGKFSKKSFNTLFGYGSKLLASQLINKIYQSLSTLIIGKFYSAKDLGAYDRGSSLAVMPSDIIGGIMQKVSFPIMAKLQDDDERLISIYRKYIKMLSMVIFFSGIMLASLAKPIVEILLTPKWNVAVIFLQIYTFSAIFIHIDTINLNLLYVKGKSNLVLKLEFFKKSLATIVLLVSVPFGVIAICIARIIYTQINVIFDSYYTAKFFNYGLIKQTRDVLPYLIWSILSTLPGFILSTFTSLNSWIVLPLGITIAMLMYYFTMRKDPIMQETINTIKSKIRTIIIGKHH